MRRLLVIVGVFMLGLAGVGRVARADGMILPEMTSPDYLGVRYHHVTVEIEENHAVTRVEQVFDNRQPFPVSGQYVFPIPPDAILTGFQATVDGALQTTTRQDAATSNALLFENVGQRQDPSLLQYADWESLTFDLSIPAGGSREMTLEYEQVLSPSGGLYHYRYILSTERYSAFPLEDVSITVDLHADSGLSSLYSSSHTVNTTRLDAGRAEVKWSAQDLWPTEDFDLFFAPAEGGFGGGLLTGQRADSNHFLFLFAPEIDVAVGDALPKDMVFVIDRSGSMSGEKIEQARNALQFILGQLNPQDRFSIVGFDDQLLVYSQTLQPVNAETLKTARNFVDGLYANNNTDIEAALQAGLDIMMRSEVRSSASPMIVFLTDGLPTAGITDDGLIASMVRQANESLAARVHVFGVGYDVNTHLLDRLAADNHGMVTYVQPGESLESVMVDFYSRIAEPVLTDLDVEFDGLAVSDRYPQRLPDMFQGSSLLLTGRYQTEANQVTVRVRGRAGDEWREYVYTFALDQTGGHDFVPRLWATRRIGQLLDQVRVEGESAALVEEIRQLGLRYGLVTPYTTTIIQAQTDGVASTANMELYQDSSALNQVSGQTTIQARVQNQSYQAATQGNLAQGANVVNVGTNSLVQIGVQNVDLALLEQINESQVVLDEDWVTETLDIDRKVTFGSEEYFALAADPAVRSYLQSGVNVIFTYQDKVILVETD